jgi:hypothetical protein
MTNYLFIGQTPRLYPNVIIPGRGSLIAEPGDVWTLDTEPGDGLWVETDALATDPGPRSWPIAAYQPDVNQDQAAERPEDEPAEVNPPKPPEANALSGFVNDDPALD